MARGQRMPTPATLTRLSLTKDKVERSIKGPLSVAESIVISTLGVGPHSLSVYKPGDASGIPIYCVGMPKAVVEIVVSLTVGTLMEIVCPIGVDGMPALSGCIDSFPYVYLSGIRPSGRVVGRHHPESREVSSPGIGFDACFGASILKGKQSLAFDAAGEHRHIIVGDV